MNRAMRFRIEPNKEQRVLFAKTFGCCRFLYNRMLSDRLLSDLTGEPMEIRPAAYKKDYPWLREVDSLALCNVQLDLERAFRTMLAYTLEERGKELVKVDRFYPSSKRCSRCGRIKETLALSDRIYHCECGCELDRDVNAAINIRWEYVTIYKKILIAETIFETLNPLYALHKKHEIGC